MKSSNTVPALKDLSKEDIARLSDYREALYNVEMKEDLKKQHMRMIMAKQAAEVP